MKLPQKYDAARRALAEATRIDEVKSFRDKATAMEVYAYQAKDGELLGYAAEMKERATRRIGEIMDEIRAAGKLAKGTRGSKVKGARVASGPTLASQNIDKHLADRARKVAKIPEDKFEVHVQKIVKRAVSAVEQSRQTKRVQSWGGEVEWYTPRPYLDAAIEVMGCIDLDPASSGIAQKHVKAEQFFDIHTDGLTQKWSGRVFLNPPYAMPFIRQFAIKIVECYLKQEISEGIFLTNNATDTEWWHLAWRTATAVCFTAGRIRFLEARNGELSERKSPTNGQTFFYFGPRPEQFKATFSRFGSVGACFVEPLLNRQAAE